MSAEERPLWLGVDFVDFAPLLRWRAEQNTKRLARLGHALPTPAALLWWLAQQPGWTGHKYATAMDVPLTVRWARAVDLGAIRPGDYLGQAGGLEAFARDYLALVASARNRTTASRQAMRLLALLPPALAARLLAADPGKTQETFGSVGLSVLKEASIFSAAIGDTGWDHGFIAIGGMGLPTTNGQAIGAVTAKGEREAVSAGLAAVRAAARAGTPGSDAANGFPVG